MSFKLKVRKRGLTPILAVYGDITGNNIGKLTVKLEHFLKIASDAIVIDLEHVSFIDSHGLGVFVFYFRRLQEQQRRFVILKPSEFIQELLSGSNLDRVFTIINDEKDL